MDADCNLLRSFSRTAQCAHQPAHNNSYAVMWGGKNPYVSVWAAKNHMIPYEYIKIRVYPLCRALTRATKTYFNNNFF